MTKQLQASEALAMVDEYVPITTRHVTDSILWAIRDAAIECKEYICVNTHNHPQVRKGVVDNLEALGYQVGPESGLNGIFRVISWGKHDQRS